MSERTIEVCLREEYFSLLPEAQRVLEELEAEVRYCLLPLSSRLDKYEKLAVTSRVKDCESALGALRRRQEGAIFDRERVSTYTLATLNDLASVRVLVFPRSRLMEANTALRGHERFKLWESDPVPAVDGSGEPLAFKYYGYCSRSATVRAELQVVPMLVGLFWQVEHAAIYKPDPQLRGALSELAMQQRTGDVYKALKDFETEFERLIRSDPLKTRAD